MPFHVASAPEKLCWSIELIQYEERPYQGIKGELVDGGFGNRCTLISYSLCKWSVWASQRCRGAPPLSVIDPKYYHSLLCITKELSRHAIAPHRILSPLGT
ncbi:hypothetical protein PAXINDRAFT_169570 [Paxillus involutus ATCC 200175]|uniref:Uncharacterized protein n=1 Tax=Paxillus involutus ATCC 200175 TaxID=664439 RepID=A0A0C9SXW4_PAXIN|nr:hypothetical protein PAXINDRAFT_169570 [Paxillus involutus ATCC 200175]